MVYDRLLDNSGNSLLHHASSVTGDIEVAKYLVDVVHCHPFHPNNEGSTPIHLACRHGNLEVAKYLSSLHPYCITCKNSKGHTPLHKACMHGHLDIVRHLAHESSSMHDDLYVSDHDGFTPLHLASKHGHLDIVMCLINECNCDVSYTDGHKYTPLHLACHYGYFDIVIFLIESNISSPDKDGVKGALHDIDKNGYTPLHYASQYGHLNIVQYLISLSKSELLCRDLHNNTPLHLAACHNQQSVVEYFLENNLYDCDLKAKKGRTPLFISAFYQCTETFDYLFRTHEQCNILMADDEGETILPLLYKWNREDIANVIMNNSKYNIFADTYKDKILLFSALEGHLKSFEHILELMAVEESMTKKLVLLMHRDSVGNTVLHLAITFGCLELVKYLINEIKLDITVSNNCGQSCVDLVLKQEHPSITAYFMENWENFYIEGENYPHHSSCQNRELLKLLSMCKSICHVNRNGCTALHIACQRGDTKIAEFLSNNHGLLLPDHNRFTPLHIACMHGHLNIVIFFNEEKKKISEWLHRSLNNNTALHLAAHYDKVLIVRYFLENNICDINLRGENGRTPLILAAFYESYETLKFLVDGYSKCDYSITDDSGKTAFWYIYNQGNVDIIKYYLNACNCKIEGNYKKRALLYTAAQKGQYVAFKLICESMKNNPVMQISERILYETDDYGNTSLHLASKFGHLEVVEYLVQNIKLSLYILNLDGQTCFHLALRHECIEIVNYLTKYATKNFFYPDKNGDTPHIFVSDKLRHIVLHLACRHGLLNIVKYLIHEVKMEVLCKDRKGLNALHHACIGGHLDVVQFLSSDSSLDVADYEGCMPLHHASRCGCLDVVQYLVSQKPSELMTRDHDNNTPLHLATKYNKTSIVNYFLKKYLYDCNLRGEHGRTPLLIATRRSVEHWTRALTALG